MARIAEQRDVRNGSITPVEQCSCHVGFTPDSGRSVAAQRTRVMGHVWTAPAVQEESDISAKRSGAAMYPACFRLEDCLCSDAAAVAAGPDVIR